jgi:hypothetical protein
MIFAVIRKSLFAMLLFAGLTFSPLHAKEGSNASNYWRVVMLRLEDGQTEHYMDYLKSEWKAEQEWAKSKGYILDYHVFANSFRRAGEPDLFIAFEFRNWPDDGEARQRQEALLAMLKQDRYQYDAGNAERARMRSYLGMILLKEIPVR